MEFKFRAVDCKPPQYVPSPSTVGCFYGQALPDPCIRTNTNMMRKPLSINEAMHRELEIMRFREMKMLAEIERQRILKEDARRELMMVQQDMAIRRVAQTEGLSYKRRGVPSNIVAPVQHPLHGRQPELQPRSHVRPLSEGLSLPRLQELVVHDNKPQVQADNSGLIVLGKPNPTLFNTKRKAKIPSAMAVENCPQGVTKNPKDEWSCALCQVTATSEVSFNEHLQGRKHKSKEAGLGAPSPKKRRMLLKINETTGSAGAKQVLKSGELLQSEEIGDVMYPKAVDSNHLCSNNKADGQILQKQCDDDPKTKQHEAVIEQILDRDQAIIVEKKKLKLLCKLCNVGAYSQSVMDAHVKGKKHTSRVRELGRNYEAATVVTAVASSD